MSIMVCDILDSYPVIAYSPLLLHSTPEKEIQHLRRLTYQLGQDLAHAYIDLLGRHDGNTAFFLLSRSLPGEVGTGEIIVGGTVGLLYWDYVLFGQAVEALGGCAISVLDEHDRILRDQVFVLTQHHHLVGITPA